ncbi:hypothetical protein NQD34_007685 [Periophthalmus magnuspinnatus]|uniref:C-reactive protein-like n=1 Tax=Periophthalmus magnuspinnatus TaxID=409849 RepID=UPI00145B6A7A|nr:C-reactive protein-like [Periophthalmus magnuspinnatus]KAJ0002536.1 hypothetical protein NQD34_007685 [Periophthalmus magnuspinnatus]
MRLLLCVFIINAPLVLCELSHWPTRYPYTTVGPGVNLKGKMVTLSQYSGVTFKPPYYQSTAGDGSVRTTDSPQWTTQWTPQWTTRPPTPGVSVCLRFLADFISVNLFTLAPGSPLKLSWSGPSQYTLSWNYYTSVSLLPRISLWPPVQTQPWTSVCVVLDSLKNVVQLFQGGSMSIRKIPSSRLVWSGERVLDVSGFDGQVTDLEVWDYPLRYTQVLSYMKNYGSSGTVLTWSNIAYRPRGNILFEETYALRQKQPIRSGYGQGQRLKCRKMCKAKRQRSQML